MLLAGVVGSVLLGFVLASSLDVAGGGALGAIVDPSGRVVSRLHAEGMGRALAYGVVERRGGGAKEGVREKARPAVAPPTGVRYQIQSGGTLDDIARIFDMPVEDVRALNPEVGPEQFMGPGAWVYVYKPGVALSKVKPGAVDALAHAVPLPDGPGRRIRRRSRSWGTETMVASLDRALTEYGKAYPEGPVVIVSDMSRREGGKLPPHHTHREGRDVDLSYVPKPDQDNGGFLMMNEWAFDVERNWTFLKAMLDTGQVEVMLMDRMLQELLYKHLKGKGMSEGELGRIFQYPRPTSAEAGIVRHWDGHRDHLHVRFACGPTEPRCGSDRSP